ncbi:MAG: hypothetical protein HY043_04265 [Verrucomicrobia bacterium]|nr:hypothetical protein [Verrucomicrobiota bacterium]
MKSAGKKFLEPELMFPVGRLKASLTRRVQQARSAGWPGFLSRLDGWQYGTFQSMENFPRHRHD